ncbi:MAG TPA: urease accessory protein UreD [Hyphomicrobiaceae bacterium]|nr:urease accessory protein UreD [Hyphomicrobiaceae bacterium]
MEGTSALTAGRLAPVRANAGIAVRFVAKAGRTRLATLSQFDGYHLRLPNSRGPVEAVIVNSGGGLVGGDRIRFDLSVGEDASVRIATVAAERVYRSLGPPSEVHVRMRLDHGARLDWLPQETILFSGGRLKRQLEAELAEDATLLLAECIVFGRAASGEEMGTGLLHDVRRIRRSGHLVFADAALIDGDVGCLLARRAIAAGARAMALVLFVAPDAQARLEPVRALLAQAHSQAGAGALSGMLVVRLLADAAQHLRADLTRVVEHLAGRAVPRVWEA